MCLWFCDWMSSWFFYLSCCAAACACVCQRLGRRANTATREDARELMICMARLHSHKINQLVLRLAGSGGGLWFLDATEEALMLMVLVLRKRGVVCTVEKEHDTHQEYRKREEETTARRVELRHLFSFWFFEVLLGLEGAFVLCEDGARCVCVRVICDANK